MYTEIREVDHFLETDIDLEQLYDIDTEDYTEGKVEFIDKVFRALKRWKWCNKIINVILSGYTFDEGFDKVQEILKHPAKCEYSGGSVEDNKRQVIRIIDSRKTTAMVLQLYYHSTNYREEFKIPLIFLKFLKKFLCLYCD